MPPIDIPEGFVTRPEASKVYNRSQRALERDLEKALATGVEKVLAHWRLVTKDGETREAAGVTSEQVEQLIAAGMVPTWCVSEEWLAETYGRKGEPKPQTGSARNDGPVNPEGERSEEPSADDDQPPQSESGGEPTALLNDVEFLKERIRTLEREKRDEVERNERREAKLFAELEVKNRQIAAWDEITQGLTKALATGQITPRLLAEARQDPSPQPVVNADPATAVDDERDTQPQASASAPASQSATAKKGSASAKSTRAKSKSAGKKRSSRTKSRKKKQPPSLFEKHTPTFHKALSGFLKRS